MSALYGWVVNARGKRPGNRCTGGWESRGPVWTGADNLAPTGFDHRTVQPTHNESLYRLSCRGPHILCRPKLIQINDYVMMSHVARIAKIRQGSSVCESYIMLLIDPSDRNIRDT